MSKELKWKVNLTSLATCNWKYARYNNVSSLTLSYGFHNEFCLIDREKKKKIKWSNKSPKKFHKWKRGQWWRHWSCGGRGFVLFPATHIVWSACKTVWKRACWGNVFLKHRKNSLFFSTRYVKACALWSIEKAVEHLVLLA